MNGLLIRTDSQQEAGSITDKLEQVLQGVLYTYVCICNIMSISQDICLYMCTNVLCMYRDYSSVKC